MDIKKAIDSIEELIRTFEGKPKIERLHIYSTTQTLISEIRNYAESRDEDGEAVPNVGLYLAEMATPLRCLARLENEDECHDDSQNIVSLMGSVQKLKSIHCFNV